MDDQPLTPEPRARGLGLGTVAGLVIAGIVVGLAVGWVAWKGGPGSAGTAGASGPATSGGNVVEGVDVTNDPVRGPEDAPVTIVEFSDFECPFCARFARQTAPLLRRQYGDRLRWYFVNNPLRSIHPHAYEAALAGECAARQDRFWDWYTAAFSGKYGLSESGYLAMAKDLGLDTGRFRTCYENAEPADEVAADMKEGQKFYILGTPTFFINGKRLEGAQPPEAFATVIDSILGAGS